MRRIVEEVMQPAPTGRMPDEQTAVDPLDEEAVSPEEQEFYNTFLNKAIEFIHGPKSSRQVLKHLNQKDLSVTEAVGRTTAMIAKNIIGSAKAAGAKVNPDAVFSASQEVVEELLELGTRAKIFPIDWPLDDGEPTPEQVQIAQDSFALAAKYFGDEMLKSEEGQSLQAEAETEVLRNVQNEAKAGTISKDFMVTNGDTVEGGVKRALVRAQPEGA
jgi:hypothetical protein